MSLNGLDHPKVAEAYQSALAEAGGWFLLKYASRDEVDVYERGSKGVSEARASIARYPDKSPLYGFLLYRRRKVLIKYLPEGTSRLLQARVAVHFQSIAEKFLPHDTVFTISSSDDLNDFTLTAACSLHAAASTNRSSGSSAQRKKLDGITEDDEEETSAGRGQMQEAGTALIPEAANISSTVAPELQRMDTAPTRVSTDRPPMTPRAKTSVYQLTLDAFPSPPAASIRETAASEYAASVTSLGQYSSHLSPDDQPRLSSQTARPTISITPDYDPYSYMSDVYRYKPKIKLGPRPATNPRKRPHTSGTASKERAVSNLPAGYKAASRKQEPGSPHRRSSETKDRTSVDVPPPPPIPNVPEISVVMAVRPNSSGTAKSLPASISTKSHGLTPEKQRLMKALELRKKRESAARAPKVESVEAPPPVPAISEEDVGKSVPAPKNDPKTEAAVASEAKASLPSSAADEYDPFNAFRSPPELASTRHSKQKGELAMVYIADTRPKARASRSSLMECQLATKDLEVLANETLSEDAEHSKADSGVEVYDNEHSMTVGEPSSPASDGSTDALSTRPSSASEIVHDDASPRTKVIEVASLSNADTATPEPTLALQEEPPLEFSSTETNELAALDADGDTDSFFQQKTVKDYDVIRHSLFVGGGHTINVTGSPTHSVHGDSHTERKEKRRGFVEPLHVDCNSAENSDTDYLSDDSFMEELQSAKVEEAKPISVSVSKSPIMPFFPRRSSSALSVGRRTPTDQAPSTEPRTSEDRLSPEQFRAKLTRFPPTSSRPASPYHEAVTLAKKTNVSSGISKRIQALAENLDRDLPASTQHSPVSPEFSSSLVALRKSSFAQETPSRPGSSGVQKKRSSRSFTPSMLTPPSDPPASSPPQSSILPKDGISTVYSVRQESDGPESISVTARIVRDGRTEKPDLTMPTEATPLELHESPVIIEHQIASPKKPSRTSVTMPDIASPLASPTRTTKEGSSSTLPRSSSDISWRSFGRRMSEAMSPPPSRSHRSMSASSLDTFDDENIEGKTSDKKTSRASRLFKRMSSTISSASRRSVQVMNPPVTEEDQEPTTTGPSSAVVIGDVNVQFPDTLLWKRRWVEIDAQGNLVLSPSRTNEYPRGVTKRYHITEFRPPFAPDQDRQELPNSVVLDFRDGRSLQCAAEDYTGQASILKTLREAQREWKEYHQQP